MLCQGRSDHRRSDSEQGTGDRMGDSYEVVSGIDYDHDTKRAEPGDVVDDLPTESVPWLLASGAIVVASEDAEVTGSVPLAAILDVDSDPEPDDAPSPLPPSVEPPVEVATPVSDTSMIVSVN